MAKPPNPFAGITLTDQTPMRQPGHDQRLFGARPAAPAADEVPDSPSEAAAPPAAKATRKRSTGKPMAAAAPAPTSQDSSADTETPSTQASVGPRYRDTTVSRWQDTWVTDTARRLRRPGKESATLRLTAEEKAQLRDVAYTYTQRRGTKTSETELIRIAIHALLEDYQTQGKGSALARVMEALEP